MKNFDMNDHIAILSDKDIGFSQKGKKQEKHLLWRRKEKGGLRLFYAVLFIMGLLFLHSEASGRSNWSDNDHYWSVSYDAGSGRFTINVLLYDTKYGPADEDGYVDYAHLQYSTNNGSSYHDFFYMDYDSGPEQK